jgi:hypothetical protein
MRLESSPPDEDSRVSETPIPRANMRLMNPGRLLQRSKCGYRCALKDQLRYVPRYYLKLSLRV